MRRVSIALAALSFSSAFSLSAATRIDDPKTFVSEVYRRLIASESTHSSYTPPEDIYTPRLERLVREDKRKAKGEIGCLDFDFWINAQDWTITHLTITATDDGPDRKTVIAKFRTSASLRKSTSISGKMQGAGSWMTCIPCRRRRGRYPGF